ncbi:MAG: carboxypeptidase-like regulatory domain-containing protein [Methanothrix sp.]|nr:carboxypeptidase-like regulatory domain-containing protein [Methanothrix sp.]
MCSASNNLSIVVGSGSYPTSFSLTGKVLDQNGQGISGVKVILSNNEGRKFSTTTDSAGYYALDVAAGVFSSMPNFLDMYSLRLPFRQQPA